MKIQNLNALEAEMQAVARGGRPAPADAGETSFNPLEALARLLTRENRALLTPSVTESPVRLPNWAG